MRITCKECGDWGDFSDNITPLEIKRYSDFLVIGFTPAGFYCVCRKCFYGHAKDAKNSKNIQIVSLEKQKTILYREI